MAKGQKKSNKEARKPKADKKAEPAKTLFANATAQPALVPKKSKKKDAE